MNLKLSTFEQTRHLYEELKFVFLAKVKNISNEILKILKQIRDDSNILENATDFSKNSYIEINEIGILG